VSKSQSESGRANPTVQHHDECGESEIPVNIFPVGDTDYQDEKDIVLNLVEDAIIPDTNPIGVCFPFQFLGTRWTRKVRQGVDSVGNSLPDLFRDPGQFRRGGRLDFDSITTGG
jgi:hypothetical protein